MINEPLPKVKFQQGAKAEGIRHQANCVTGLIDCGFRIAGTSVRVRQCGVEIDILAANRHDVYFPWECKGGLGRGLKVGGFLSSDNVKKAVGSATSLANSLPWIDKPCTPMMVMTPFIARPPSQVFNQFAPLPVQILADVIDDRDSASLKMWSNMDYFAVEAYLREMNLLCFRLFANRHWRLDGTASRYLAELQNEPVFGA